MGDLIFGEPPFYVLAGHGGVNPNTATGGARSVRGVPSQRLHGHRKLLANLELRAKFLPFDVGDQRFNLGALAFFDAARVWSVYEPNASQADDGAGLMTGFGGGLRLQWGETFILRADVGWSTRDDTLGVYVDIGHVF